MVARQIEECPQTRGGSLYGLSVYGIKVPLTAATTIAVTIPMKTPLFPIATIDSLVSAPVSTGTAFVTATISGNTVTLASFDDTGAATNFDKDVYLVVFGQY